MSKESILAELSLLPLATLEKLDFYSKRLVIPDENMLANVTMKQMVDQANSLADKLFPEWTDRSKTDFGMFLVELMALFSEKDFWYLNTFANESLLSKMQIYSVAYIRAVELGHTPANYKSANGTFDLSFNAGASTDYLPGYFVAKNSLGIPFTNLETFNVPLSVSSSIQSVTLYQGSYVSETYQFNGVGIFLRQKKIDVSSIKVFKEGVTPWTKVPVFGQSTSTSEHFIVLPEEDGTASIFFGEDGYGVTPELGTTFTVTYLVCKGSEGNTDILPLTVEKNITTRPVTLITQAANISNGVDGETLASIKNTALNYFTGKHACYNADTTKRFLNSQVEINKSHVVILGNMVNFYVQPKDGSTASTALLLDLESRLLPFVSDGYDAVGNITNYVSAGPIVADVYYLKGYDEAITLNTVKQLISDYTNPVVLAKYGADFDLTELSLLLRSNIPGLQNIIFTSVAGISPANVAVSSEKMLSKVLTTDITLTPYAVS